MQERTRRKGCRGEGGGGAVRGREKGRMSNGGEEVEQWRRRREPWAVTNMNIMLHLNSGLLLFHKTSIYARHGFLTDAPRVCEQNHKPSQT